MSSVAIKFISFFLFPFFARKFNPEDYGVINIFNTLTFFINAVIVLGLDAATTRWFYEEDSKSFRSKIFSNWFYTHLGTAAAAVLLLLLVGHFYFLDAFIHVPNSRLLLLVVGLNILLQVPPLVINGYFVLRKMPVPSASFSVASSLIAALCSLYFVFKLQWGILGFYLGQTIAFFLYALIGYLFYLKKVVAIRFFDKEKLKEMVRYGINIIPANVSGQLSLFVSALIIQSFVSQKDLGYYQIAGTLASGIMLLSWPFALAFQPLSFSIMNQPYADVFYAFILNVYVLVLCSITFFLALFYPELIHLLLTDKYSNSAVVSGILTFANFVYSLSFIATLGMAKVKKIKYFGRVVSVCNLLTLGFIYVLARNFGLAGAASGLLIGQSLAVAGLFFYSQKSYPIPYDLGKIAFVITAALGLFVGYNRLFIQYPHQVLIKCFFLLSFVLVAVATFPKLINRVKRFKNYLNPFL